MRRIDQGPLTARICSPISLARWICFWSVVAARSASVRVCTVSLRTAEPMPSASTRSAQKNWSPKNGLMIVGMPARTRVRFETD